MTICSSCFGALTLNEEAQLAQLIPACRWLGKRQPSDVG
jgi:hypothetical protein